MKGRNIIRKFLWSYCIVWLPVLLVSLIISESTLYSLRKKEEDKIQEKMLQVVLDLQEKYQKCFDNGIILADTKELRLASFLESPYASYQGMEVLKRNKQYNMDVYDILLYYGGTEVYSVSGLYTAGTYFRKHLQCSEEGVEEGLFMLEGDVGGIYFLESGTGDGYLCYHVPVLHKDGEIQTVTYLYTVDSFVDVLNYYSGDNIAEIQLQTHGMSLCLSREGDELVIRRAQSGEENPESAQQQKSGSPVAQNQPTDSADKLQDTNKSDKTWDVYGIDNLQEIGVTLAGRNGNDIVLRYRTDISFEEVKQVQLVNYSLIIFGTICSLIITISLSSNKARRIQSLEEALDMKSEVPDLQDEYQYLRTLIRNMVQESDKLLANEGIYKRMLLQQNTRLLFCGGMEEEDEMMLLLHMCGVELLEEHYCVCAFLIDQSSEEYQSLIMGDLCYSQVLQDATLFFSLFELPNPDQSGKLRQNVVLEKAALLENMGAESVMAAVSRVYSNITEAHCAYREVSRMMGEGVRNDWRGFRKCREGMWIRYCADEDFLVKEGVSAKTQAASDQAEEQQNQDRFREILAYIEENYMDCNLTADLVAEHVQLSKIYLSRLFKQKMDMTYMDYLTNLRMKHVEELLAETDKSIVDICNEVGYLDVSSFRRKFKKIYGMSVSEYRQRRQSE